MAKQYKPAKIWRPKKNTPGKQRRSYPVTTMEDVMEWTFDKYTTPPYENLMSIFKLKPGEINTFVNKTFPRLSHDEKKELVGLLKGQKGRNAIIHSRKVLFYMRELILRHSEPPPPWRG